MVPNYLCRPGFGTLCCESGLLFTYGDNSHRRRLTPWVNDPVTPQGGEFLVVEDLDTGEMFSPTRLPFGQAMTCRVVHSPGVTVYRAFGEGLELQWTCFTDPQQEAGCRQLRIPGAWQCRSAPVPVRMSQVCHGHRPACGTLYLLDASARHGAGGKSRLALPWLSYGPGAGGGSSPHEPGSLPGPMGAAPVGVDSAQKPSALDSAEPCVIGAADRGNPGGAYPHLHPEKEGGATFTYLTGLARDPEEIEGLLERYRREGVSAMQRQVQRFWSGELSAFTCHVPWESLSLMLNLCLPYQVRVARLWARAGLYQAGGPSASGISCRT